MPCSLVCLQAVLFVRVGEHADGSVFAPRHRELNLVLQLGSIIYESVEGAGSLWRS